MEKRYFDVEFTCHGGLFTCGVVTDPDEVDLLRQTDEDGELSPEVYGEIDGNVIEVSCNDYGQIAMVYGMNLGDSFETTSMVVTELKRLKDDSFEVIEGSEKSFTPDGSTINYLSLTSPDWSPKKLTEKFGSEGIIFSAMEYEKYVNGVVRVETDDDFDPKKMWIKWRDLDNIFSIWPTISSGFLYGTKEELLEKLIAAEPSAADYFKNENLVDNDSFIDMFDEFNADEDVNGVKDFTSQFELSYSREFEGGHNSSEAWISEVENGIG